MDALTHWAGGTSIAGSAGGFTMVEMMVGASIIAIVIAALMGSYVGQMQLSAHARNLTAAMNDATRVLEQIRIQNVKGQGTCAGSPPLPSVKPPAPYTSWNAWLNTGAPGAPKSINQPNRDTAELAVVTCQDEDGGASAADYCGSNQAGTTEWKVRPEDSTFDPLRVTVAVTWSQQSRAVGEKPVSGSEATYVPAVVTCTQANQKAPKVCTTTTPASFVGGPDANGNGVVDSPAMLTTLVSCR